MATAAIKRYQKQIDSLRRSTKRAREKAGEMVEHTITSVETAGAGFAFGYMSGKFPEMYAKGIFGVQPDLAVGVGCHVFALFGAGGNADSHLRAVGNGALAAYAYGAGRRLGARQGTAGEVSPSDYALPPHMAGDELEFEDVEDMAMAY